MATQRQPPRRLLFHADLVEQLLRPFVIAAPDAYAGDVEQGVAYAPGASPTSRYAA